jgi:hypothetical protein
VVLARARRGHGARRRARAPRSLSARPSHTPPAPARAPTGGAPRETVRLTRSRSWSRSWGTCNTRPRAR